VGIYKRNLPQLYEDDLLPFESEPERLEVDQMRLEREVVLTGMVEEVVEEEEVDNHARCSMDMAQLAVVEVEEVLMHPTQFLHILLLHHISLDVLERVVVTAVVEEEAHILHMQLVEGVEVEE
jgi:hypothetical protein